MNVLKFELKHIFRPTVIAITVICAFIMCFFSTELFDSQNGYRAHYGIDKNNHWNGGDYIDRSTAEEFRVYKWFINTYGYKMTDEVAEKLRTLKFPLLDEIISEHEEFAEFGIYSTDDLLNFHDRYFDNTTMRLFNGSPTEEAINEVPLITRLKSQSLPTFFYDYTNKYISESALLREYGINSVYDLNAFEAEFMYGDGEQSTPNEEQERLYKTLFDEVNRVHAEYVVPAMEQGEYDERLDEARWQYKQMEFAHLAQYYYEKCKLDSFYILDGSLWVSGAYKTYTDYYNARSNAFWHKDSEAALDTLKGRMEQRIDELGDGWYNVRQSEMTHGLRFSTEFFMSLSAALAVLMTLPFALRDKLSRVSPVQYSTKTGRRVLNIQLIAVLLLSLVISLLTNAAMLYLAHTDLYAEFYDLPMNSYLSSEIYWLDLTMRQYLIIALVFNVLITAAAAVIAFFVGRLCGGYVSAFAAELALVIAVLFLYKNPLAWLFTLPETRGEDFAWMAGIVGAAAVVMAAMLVRNRERGL